MRVLLFLFMLLASPATAQETGFFDRLFGTDSAESDGEQGSLIERLLEDNLSSVGRDVRVRGFRGALSRKATLDSLVISDADGPWLELRDAELDWDRGALFNGRLVVHSLSAKVIELPRLPRPEGEGGDGSTALGFKLPELPIAVSVDEILAERVVLGAPVLGHAAEVAVSGNLQLANGEGMGSLILNRLDARGKIALEGAYSNTTEVLALGLSFDEEANGIFANLAGVPGRPSVHFTAKGEAPINDFVADIRLATDGQERLAGQVITSQPAGSVLRVVMDLGGDIAPLFLPEYQPFFGSNVGFGATVTRFQDGSLDVEGLSLKSRALNLQGLVRLGAGGLPKEISVIGGIGHVDGSPVLLPLPGAEIRVDRARLDVSFDAETGSVWRGLSDVQGFDHPAFSAENLTLAGVGQIEEAPSRVSGDFSFQALSADLKDAGLSAALGRAISGKLLLDWQANAPLRVSDFALEGASYSMSGRGSFENNEADGTIEGELQASFADLSVLSTIAGRPLGGALDVTAAGSSSVDLNAYALKLSLEGDGVGVGDKSLDALLAGKLGANLAVQRADDLILIEAFEVSTDLLSANAAGTIGGGEPLSFEASLKDISPIISEFSGPVSVEGSLRQGDDKRLLVDASGRAPGGLSAHVSGDLSRNGKDLNLNLEGVGPVAIANRFIQPRSLSGTARYDFALRGAPALSSVSGRISFGGIRFSDPELRLALVDVAGNVSLASGRASVDLTANVEGGGRVVLTGPIGISAPNDAELRLRLFAARLRDPRLYDTTVSGDVRIIGPIAGGARISGDLFLGETNIRIPQSGLGGSAEIPELVHLNEPPPVRSTRRRAGLLRSSTEGAGRRKAFPLDLTIRAPNRVFVRGRGLESEFGGELRLGGTTADVVPSGGFSLIRGRLDILGRRLRLEEALITLQGSFEPVLRILAVADVEDVRVNVRVDGPADDPEITFSSSPELPQEEVLSWLIFGRGLETLSPLQAARLALAVRALSGRGGEGVVGKIRRKSGLADFDVTTDADGNAAVRAGTYLGENVYTDVTVGAEGRTKLNLNLDIAPSITLKGGFANDGESSVGVFFERDY